MVHGNFHFSNESLGSLGFDRYKGVEDSKEGGTSSLLLLFKHSQSLTFEAKQTFHTTWF